MSSPESQGVSKYKNAPSSSPGICGQGWFPPTRSFNHTPCQTFEISHRLLLASAFENEDRNLGLGHHLPLGSSNDDRCPACRGREHRQQPRRPEAAPRCRRRLVVGPEAHGHQGPTTQMPTQALRDSLQALGRGTVPWDQLW